MRHFLMGRILRVTFLVGCFPLRPRRVIMISKKTAMPVFSGRWPEGARTPA